MNACASACRRPRLGRRRPEHRCLARRSTSWRTVRERLDVLDVRNAQPEQSWSVGANGVADGGDRDAATQRGCPPTRLSQHEFDHLGGQTVKVAFGGAAARRRLLSEGFRANLHAIRAVCRRQFRTPAVPGRPFGLTAGPPLAQATKRGRDHRVADRCESGDDSGTGQTRFGGNDPIRRRAARRRRARPNARASEAHARCGGSPQHLRMTQLELLLPQEALAWASGMRRWPPRCGWPGSRPDRHHRFTDDSLTRIACASWRGVSWLQSMQSAS